MILNVGLVVLDQQENNEGVQVMERMEYKVVELKGYNWKWNTDYNRYLYEGSQIVEGDKQVKSTTGKKSAMIQEYLNDMASDGWNLINVTNKELYLKRKVIK